MRETGAQHSDHAVQIASRDVKRLQRVNHESHWPMRTDAGCETRCPHSSGHVRGHRPVHNPFLQRLLLKSLYRRRL